MRFIGDFRSRESVTNARESLGVAVLGEQRKHGCLKLVNLVLDNKKHVLLHDCLVFSQNNA